MPRIIRGILVILVFFAVLFGIPFLIWGISGVTAILTGIVFLLAIGGIVVKAIAEEEVYLSPIRQEKLLRQIRDEIRSR